MRGPASDHVSRHIDLAGSSVAVMPARRLVQPDRRTLRTQVLAALREELISGGLQPGQRVNEVEVAEELGVSRGTLREAIRNLEQEGLLESVPHRGTFVRQLTPEEVVHVYEVRASLESRAARNASKYLDDAMRDKLERALANFQRVSDSDAPFRDIVVADLAFHEAICEASGNPILLGIWRSITGLITAVMLNAGPRPLRHLQTVESHRILLDAIEKGDDATTLAAFSEHFNHGAEELAKTMRARLADKS
jgi:DNA-binding GntR family transcriptional regulator